MKLYDYQKNIVNRTLQTKESTLIQLPTGGGKTHIATAIIQNVIDLFGDFSQVLFIAPKIVLMEQTIKAFEKADLKPQKVHGVNKFNINHRVLVSTLHTASRRKKLKPDIIIVDEVHYGFKGDMLKKLIKNNPDARLIGLSATPYDESGKRLKGFLYIDDISVQFLMNNGFLVPKLRQYELVKQNLSGIKIIAGDYDKSELSTVVCNKNTILEIVETTREFISNSKKTIVFAVDIMHAEILTKAYQDAGFSAQALHSKSRNDDNDEPLEIEEAINDFRKGSTKVLVSVLMLTTGFDVPDTDCAVIARPTKSQNLYKQMVGRILRKAENKKEAILLDCGNVINNLGMPLAPIVEVKELKNTPENKCSECESTNIKLIKRKDTMFWKCLDCDYEKELKSANYKCENCNEVYGLEGDFIFEDNKLFLDCSCGYKTVISEYNDEELVEVIDNDEDLIIKELKSNNKKIEKIPLDVINHISSDNKIVEENVNTYLSFEEAIKFVRTLGLKSKKEWHKYCREEYKIDKPSNIPSRPEKYYKNKGWISYDYWLQGNDLDITRLSENAERIRNKVFNFEKKTSEFLGQISYGIDKKKRVLKAIKTLKVRMNDKIQFDIDNYFFNVEKFVDEELYTLQKFMNDVWEDYNTWKK